MNLVSVPCFLTSRGIRRAHFDREDQGEEEDSQGEETNVGPCLETADGRAAGQQRKEANERKGPWGSGPVHSRRLPSLGVRRGGTPRASDASGLAEAIRCDGMRRDRDSLACLPSSSSSDSSSRAPDDTILIRKEPPAESCRFRPLVTAYRRRRFRGDCALGSVPVSQTTSLRTTSPFLIPGAVRRVYKHAGCCARLDPTLRGWGTSKEETDLIPRADAIEER